MEELGGKTPLEAAVTPCLDRLAREGSSGLVYPVEKGVAPESDLAVISLLGYDAKRYYTGRGPLESYAAGLEVNPGDLALRVNFATVDSDGKKIIDRRVGRDLNTKEARALADEVNKNVILSQGTFELKSTVGHRGVLVIRGIRSRLSGWITNTDPAYEKEGVFSLALEKFSPYVLSSQPYKGREEDECALAAARLLTEWTEKAHKVLQWSSVNKTRRDEGKLAANIILSRDAGDRLPEFPSIEKNYNLKFASFVEMPVERGIALLTGMDIVDVPERTGDLEKDYSAWARIALEKVAEYDGLYIHIKGPDEPAHDGDSSLKKKIIEAIDKFFFANLLNGVDNKNSLICVTADHSTPCAMKAHSADPVPLLIFGGSLSPDTTQVFSERAARSGSLGEMNGCQILPTLIQTA